VKDITIQRTTAFKMDNDPIKRDEELKKACREFEAVFTYQLLKSMRKTIEKSDLFHGGQGEEIYESLLDQELSKQLAGSGGTSLANLLYQQLRGKAGLGELPETDMGEAVDSSAQNFQWPLKTRISSGFGWREDPITGQQRFHQGVDLPAAEGSPVRAALSGRVVYSDFKQDYGHVVVLDHGQGFTTLYAHNQENLVKTGDLVRKGDFLARVGSSGRSTGPHLHFEVRKDGDYLDPLDYLDFNKGKKNHKLARSGQKKADI
jgi:murein DD-endopeptidase MepM/ murein hydrolase activator NlpD